MCWYAIYQARAVSIYVLSQVFEKMDLTTNAPLPRMEGVLIGDTAKVDLVAGSHKKTYPFEMVIHTSENWYKCT